MLRKLARYNLSVLLVASSLSCATTTNTIHADALSPSDQSRAMAVVDSFWTAAATADTSALVRLTANEDPLTWALEEDPEGRFRRFLVATAGQLKYIGGRKEPAGTVLLEVQIPWVTCKSPPYPGVKDTYYFRLIPSETSYRLLGLWMDVC